MKLPNWYDVYPHGTKEGDEEFKFFVALSRDKRYTWRSTAALAKECGITKARVEEIIVKYYNKKMIYQNPKNDDQWGYWQKVKDNFPELLPKEIKTIAKQDHDNRIKKALGN